MGPLLLPASIPEQPWLVGLLANAWWESSKGSVESSKGCVHTPPPMCHPQCILGPESWGTQRLQGSCALL